MILFAALVGTALLDEAHVLGVNPEVTGCQHLCRVATSKEKRTERAGANLSAFNQAAEKEERKV